jgi:hypothetical protein
MQTFPHLRTLFAAAVVLVFMASGTQMHKPWA